MKHLLCALLFVAGLGAKEVYAIFNVKALQDANLTLDSAGIVDAIYVDVGSKVKKGEVLLTLYNRDKKSQVDSIIQQYDFMRKQYERYSKIGRSIDKNTLDKYYSDYKKLEYDRNYSQAVVDKTILKAPFDGVIASKNIELGDGMSANSTILFRLVSKGRKMVIEFDSKYLPDVKVGDTFVYSIDGKPEKQKVKITKIYPTIDENTRKVSAEALLPANSLLVPGVFGDGFIQ
ncbi:efflux RND transporter periplasmic adaptor subunit [Helicobacter ailurogastricus]|uniref:Membrane fusion protein of RND family multidrug efflux pump n=1 Tax=Helicobacter ailurogastricus TaxID=1578720 RepID=A0A0K2XZ31_9HELI|nr:HlyD family efflux transporter periplasmic adaptor subunit [Helicobacter ailurogastricus]BDQ29025.1 membrane protein [Helicobacter ailurogastricus]CRF51918.1 Membrane fusion protein of RND family multidrug efflux pump [Helicobacter ailurogastricus]